MKLERALLGSLGRSSKEDLFCRLQEEQGKKKSGEVEKWHKMHFDCNTAPSWPWGVSCSQGQACCCALGSL